MPVLANGSIGVVATVDGEATSIMGFTVVNTKIVAISVLADSERISQLDLNRLRD